MRAAAAGVEGSTQLEITFLARATESVHERPRDPCHPGIALIAGRLVLLPGRPAQERSHSPLRQAQGCSHAPGQGLLHPPHLLLTLAQLTRQRLQPRFPLRQPALQGRRSFVKGGGGLLSLCKPPGDDVNLRTEGIETGERVFGELAEDIEGAFLFLAP